MNWLTVNLWGPCGSGALGQLPTLRLGGNAALHIPICILNYTPTKKLTHIRSSQGPLESWAPGAVAQLEFLPGAHVMVKLLK